MNNGNGKVCACPYLIRWCLDSKQVFTTFLHCGNSAQQTGPINFTLLTRVIIVLAT